ncbi:preprotein translocase subunit YajC [Nocardioides sp. SYSU DS0651]|uniref:preprotein translocase subunit YajC n=1 Tax=Nocardioides sp. SYSU DS0651 TaxID=3415955 RepID=UPI003F4B8F36
MKELVPWLWIAAIALIFWLLIIRPASKRQKEIAALQSSLSVGDDVVLTSGVFATITELTDDHVAAEIAPGVVIRVVRGAIGSVRRDEVETAGEVDRTDRIDPAGPADPADPAGPSGPSGER